MMMLRLSGDSVNKAMNLYTCMQLT